MDSDKHFTYNQDYSEINDSECADSVTSSNSLMYADTRESIDELRNNDQVICISSESSDSDGTKNSSEFNDINMTNQLTETSENDDDETLSKLIQNVLNNEISVEDSSKWPSILLVRIIYSFYHTNHSLYRALSF